MKLFFLGASEDDPIFQLAVNLRFFRSLSHSQWEELKLIAHASLENQPQEVQNKAADGFADALMILPKQNETVENGTNH